MDVETERDRAQEARRGGPPDQHRLGRRSGRGVSLTLEQAEAMTAWPIIVAAYGLILGREYDYNSPTAPRTRDLLHGIEQYQAESR